MKRLVSLDWLRGWAILTVLLFHAVIFNNDAPPDAGRREAPTVLALLEYFVAWAGLFAVVSGIGNTVSLHARMERARPRRGRVLGHAIGGGLAVVALNYLYLAVFTPGFMPPGVPSIGLLPGLVRTGSLVPSTPERLLFCTALMMIGWGKVAAGVVVYLRTRRPIAERRWTGLALTALAGSAIVLGWPSARALLRPLVALPLTPARLLPDLVLTWLVGPMDPAIPYVGFSLLGAVTGLLVAEGAPRRIVAGWGWGIALAWTVPAFVLWRRVGYWNNLYDVPELAPLVEILGPVLLLVAATLHLMDLRPDQVRQRWWRRTRGVRLFGLVSLSAFLLEGTVSALLRRAVELARPGFTRDAWFLFLVFAPLVLVVWRLALGLWARVHFAGSLEWVLVHAAAWFTVSKSRRLNADELMRTPAAYVGATEVAVPAIEAVRGRT